MCHPFDRTWTNGQYLDFAEREIPPPEFAAYHDELIQALQWTTAEEEEEEEEEWQLSSFYFPPVIVPQPMLYYVYC